MDLHNSSFIIINDYLGNIISQEMVIVAARPLWPYIYKRPKTQREYTPQLFMPRIIPMEINNKVFWFIFFSYLSVDFSEIIYLLKKCCITCTQKMK